MILRRFTPWSELVPEWVDGRIVVAALVPRLPKLVFRSPDEVSIDTEWQDVVKLNCKDPVALEKLQLLFDQVARMEYLLTKKCSFRLYLHHFPTDEFILDANEQIENVNRQLYSNYRLSFLDIYQHVFGIKASTHRNQSVTRRQGLAV